MNKNKAYAPLIPALNQKRHDAQMGIYKTVDDSVCHLRDCAAVRIATEVKVYESVWQKINIAMIRKVTE